MSATILVANLLGGPPGNGSLGGAGAPAGVPLTKSLPVLHEAGFSLHRGDTTTTNFGDLDPDGLAHAVESVLCFSPSL